MQGSTGFEVKDVQIDSRKVSEGTLFVAIRGEKTDGHQFIDKAIALGAKSILCEVMPTEFAEGITYVQVNNTNEAVAYVAHNFYDEPSTK